MSHYERYKQNRHSSYRWDKNDDYYDYQQEKSSLPKARSKIMGVCAGIAQQFGWDVTVVRILAVVGLFTFTGPVFLAYIVAGALFY